MRTEKHSWGMARGKVWKLKETKFKFQLCHLCCVNLGKFPNISESKFSHLKIGIIITTILSYFKQ